MQNPNTFYTSNNSTALEILPDNLNLNITPLSLQKEALEKNPLKYHELASEEKEEEEKSVESPTLPPVSIDEEIKEDSDPAHALANNINTRENVEALDSEGGNKIWIHNPAQGDNSIDFINESVDPEEELSQSSKLAEENENLSDNTLDKGFVADSDEDNSEQSLLLALPSFGDQPFSDFDINEQDNNQDFEVNFDGDSSDQSILASLKETQASTNDHPSSSGSGSEISSPLLSG